MALNLFLTKAPIQFRCNQFSEAFCVFPSFYFAEEKKVESVSVIDIDLIKGGYNRVQPEFQLVQVFFAMLIK